MKKDKSLALNDQHSSSIPIKTLKVEEPSNNDDFEEEDDTPSSQEKSTKCEKWKTSLVDKELYLNKPKNPMTRRIGSLQ